MKNQGIIFLLIVMFLNVNLYSKEQLQNFYGVKYLKNYDGDTATFEIQLFQKGKTIIKIEDQVRFRNINAEEIRNKDLKKKEIAIKQKEELRNKLINAKSIDLIDCKREKYGRMLCDLEIEN